MTQTLLVHSLLTPSLKNLLAVEEIVLLAIEESLLLATEQRASLRHKLCVIFGVYLHRGRVWCLRAVVPQVRIESKT